MDIRIYEEYPSINGESLHVGRTTYLVRCAGCNLRCRHCYFGEPTDSELTLAELLGLALQIRRDFGRKTCICLTGGEPLLRPDLLPLLRFLDLLEFRPALTSNGTLLDPTTVWRIARSRSVSLRVCSPSGQASRSAIWYSCSLMLSTVLMFSGD